MKKSLVRTAVGLFILIETSVLLMNLKPNEPINVRVPAGSRIKIRHYEADPGWQIDSVEVVEERLRIEVCRTDRPTSCGAVMFPLVTKK